MSIASSVSLGAGDSVWPLTTSSSCSSGSRASLVRFSTIASSSPQVAPSNRIMGACSIWGCTLDPMIISSCGRGRPVSSAAAAAAIATLKDLLSFICDGPLLQTIGLNPEKVSGEIDEWISLGLRLSRILGFNELMLSDSEKTRIYHYYLPVYMWCKKELERHRDRYADRDQQVPALVIGISAPQGCGKTTLVDALEYLFNSTGSPAASVSIDDFYLTAADQETLAREFNDNALLELRGNAGSHDLVLGSESIKSLRSLADGEVASVPHYDKSANNGRGDRSDPSTWTKVTGPLQVILFEGWMLGFKPVETSAVKAVDPQLEVVNENLVKYQESWFNLVDSWIVVQVEDPSWVYEWRLQAEVAMKAEGKPGMSDEQIADFVGRYMPAYKAYLQKLYSEGPGNSKPDRILKFSIDKNRNPIG